MYLIVLVFASAEGPTVRFGSKAKAVYPFTINGILLGRLVAADLPVKINCSRSCAHAQNYVNNGNLSGKSAAT